MNHLRQAWGKKVEAWRVPDTIRGYPLPTGGQFAHSKSTLDPDVFDPSERMHPWIRGSLMAILDAFWGPRYGEDWAEWTRIYLAGSLASYWWHTPDFDTLVGLHTPVFVSRHPEFSGMSDQEVCQALNHEFILELDPLMKDWSFPPAVDLARLLETLGHPHAAVPVYDSLSHYSIEPFGPMEVTWYVNPASWDIRVIRPYAAYEVISDKWYVHPARMDKAWGAHALDHAFWERMADVGDEIKAALALPEPERTERSLEIYNRVHKARGEAFSVSGRGVTDPRSLQWIVLNRWGLLGPLEVAAHPGREMSHLPPAVASSWRAMDPGAEQGGHGAWREHDAVVIPEGGASGRKHYTLYTYGEPMASHPTLGQAKANLEEIYGPLQWQRHRPEKLTTVHRHYGPTTEFSDPAEYHYVHSLPRLG